MELPKAYTNLEIMSCCILSTLPQTEGDNLVTRFLFSPVSTKMASCSLYTSLQKREHDIPLTCFIRPAGL